MRGLEYHKGLYIYISGGPLILGSAEADVLVLRPLKGQECREPWGSEPEHCPVVSRRAAGARRPTGRAGRVSLFPPRLVPPRPGAEPRRLRSAARPGAGDVSGNAGRQQAGADRLLKNLRPQESCPLAH